MDIEGLKKRLRAGRFALDEVAPIAAEAANAIEQLQHENEKFRSLWANASADHSALSDEYANLKRELDLRLIALSELNRELEAVKIDRDTFQHGHRIASNNCVRLECELEEARRDAASQRELRDAVWNLMQTKGRHNTEIAYHLLEAAYLKAVKDAAREKQG